jgi:hypothetical protein
MSSENQKDNIMNKLSQYMNMRAHFENVQWELTEQDLKPYFDKGVRSFFGVTIDDNGNLISDDNQPSFFNSYKSTSIN